MGCRLSRFRPRTVETEQGTKGQKTSHRGTPLQGCQTHVQNEFKRPCSRTECLTPGAAQICEEEHSEAINPDSLQHSKNLNVDYVDTYILFRDKYLISNVNSRPEASRPRSALVQVKSTRRNLLLLLLLRPREGWSMAKDATLSRRVVMTTRSCGATIIGMLDSGAQINCVSQHIVQKHKYPVYLYAVPFELGMAVEGDKYEVTSYTEIPYKIAQFSGKLSLSVLPSVSGFDIILGLPWLQTVNYNVRLLLGSPHSFCKGVISQIAEWQ